MTPQQAEVAKWMLAFGQEVPGKPIVPSSQVIELRANLIEEEAIKETVKHLRELADVVSKTEFIDAVPNFRARMMSLIADDLADLLVVTYGTAAAFGIDIEPIFAEVMRSNWTKLWTANEVNRAMPDDCFPTQIPVRRDRDDRCWIVKRKSDSKVIKSPSYSPANLLPIIEAQMKGTPHA